VAVSKKNYHIKYLNENSTMPSACHDKRKQKQKMMGGIRLTGSAWFWLVFVVFYLWVVPISLFIYNHKVERNEFEQWPVSTDEEIKFSRIWEIIIIMAICVGTSWLIHLGTIKDILRWL
jgi:hypothetical protein